MSPFFQESIDEGPIEIRVIRGKDCRSVPDGLNVEFQEGLGCFIFANGIERGPSSFVVAINRSCNFCSSLRMIRVDSDEETSDFFTVEFNVDCAQIDQFVLAGLEPCRFYVDDREDEILWRFCRSSIRELSVCCSVKEEKQE